MKAIGAILVCFAAMSLVAASADAKARYAGKAEMIHESIAIAVVEITDVQKVQVKGKHWTYSQRAMARVEAVLKGDLAKGNDAATALHGGEDFICAQCRFEPGRYLVFLSQDAGLWTGSNWQLSVRPIIADADGKQMVEWYADEKTHELKPQPLAEVIADVKKGMEAEKAAK